MAHQLRKGQQNRLRKIMAEWKAVVHIEGASKKLETTRRAEQGADLLLFLRENSRNAQLRKLSLEAKSYSCSDIYSRKLLSKSFTGLKINAKSNLLLRVLRSPRYTEFIVCLKNYNK